MRDLEVEARVRKLEQRAGRWRWLLVATPILLVSTVLAGRGFASPEAGIVPEIRTQRLIVLDHEGRKRVEIGEDAPDRTSSATPGWRG